MEATINKVCQRLDSSLRYLRPLLPLANCHLVDFLTQRHWDTLLPHSLRHTLDGLSLNNAVDAFWDACEDGKNLGNSELERWVQAALAHHVGPEPAYCLSRGQLRGRLRAWGGGACPDVTVSQFMTAKKTYEVSRMSGAVGALAKASGAGLAAEAGGGRAPLLAALCLAYSLPALSLDCNPRALTAAQHRASKMKKQWRAISVLADGGRDEVGQAAEARGPTDGGCRDGGRGEAAEGRTDGGRRDGGRGEAAEGRTDGGRRDGGRGEAAEGRTDGGRRDGEPAEAEHKFAAAFLSRDTDLAHIARQCFPHLPNMKILLTGLHTCGNLGAECLRMLVSQTAVVSALLVPCCYHLASERGDGRAADVFRRDYGSHRHPPVIGFPMSRHLTERGAELGRQARMLAAHSLARQASARRLPVRALLYRALLQDVVSKRLGSTAILSEGKLKRISSKCESFQQYFQLADDKLQLNLYHTFTEQCFKDINRDIEDHWKKLVLFYLLRLCLAQVVEGVILLDRLLFLLENGLQDVFLVKLFDPVLSPRCHAIVAKR